MSPSIRGTGASKISTRLSGSEHMNGCHQHSGARKYLRKNIREVVVGRSEGVAGRKIRVRSWRAERRRLKRSGKAREGWWKWRRGGEGEGAGGRRARERRVG